MHFHLENLNYRDYELRDGYLRIADYDGKGQGDLQEGLLANVDGKRRNVQFFTVDSSRNYWVLVCSAVVYSR